MSVYLATRGKQDYFLTEKPEFTFFQKTYERDVQHENTIANVPFDSGGGTIATIPANGDYVAEITLKVTLPPGRETPYIASQDTGWVPCTKVADPVYTGTKVKGIGTMHKSNGVPIFSDEEAIAISTMRR